MKSLDLRKSGCLSVENSKRITLLADEISLEYNSYIGRIIKDNHIKDLQWLLRVVCRNTYVSLIYDRMCRLALLEDRLKDGKDFNSIMIDSGVMYSPVRQLLEKYNSQATITTTSNSKYYKKFYFIYTLYSLIRSFYICFNFWLWPRFMKFTKTPTGSVYLLDTFILQNSLDKNFTFNDRYYTGLTQNIEKSKREKTWYLPTLHGFRYPWEWMNFFYQVSKSKHNILLKERWLTSTDYFFSIWKSLTLAHTVKKIPSWRGLDISLLVKEEIYLDRGSFSMTQALLIYRFFMRLKNKGIKVEGVLDWFENQNIDRALYLGVRKHYPKTRIKGYLGFVPEDYYLGLSPVEYEQEGGVLPDEILVIGDAFIPHVRRYLPQIHVSVAPAFRFKETINFQKDNSIDKDTILLAMPMILDEAKDIIHLARNAWRDKNFKWVIKLHPTIHKKYFQNIIPESLDAQFEFTEDTIPNLLQRTHLLVTSASSVALEALICGTSVAILGNRSGPTINSLQGVVDKAYWSICYTSDDLIKTISEDFNKVEIPLSSSEYFLEVSLDRVKKMMRY
jgi:hypothetical protein